MCHYYFGTGSLGGLGATNKNSRGSRVNMRKASLEGCMKRMSQLLSLAFFVALVADATAQDVAPPPFDLPAPPTPKKIRIRNNTPGPIYVLIQSPTRLRALGASDLWMQAQFKVDDWVDWKTKRMFTTTRLYRAYFEVGKKSGKVGADQEPSTGIAPNQSVEITVPFYTQLKKVSKEDVGTVDDQFIDWWNAVRIYLFDTEAAYHSAKVTNNLEKVPGGGLPQPTVSTIPGPAAAGPTCTSSDGKVCNVLLRESAINTPFNIPFELQEYTFASAEGPPTHLKKPT